MGMKFKNKLEFLKIVVTRVKCRFVDFFCFKEKEALSTALLL